MHDEAGEKQPLLSLLVSGGGILKTVFVQMGRSKLMKEVVLFLSYLHLYMFLQKPPLFQGSGRGKVDMTYYFEFSLNLFLIKLFHPQGSLIYIKKKEDF